MLLYSDRKNAGVLSLQLVLPKDSQRPPVEKDL